jgi:ankyrin repeat protein
MRSHASVIWYGAHKSECSSAAAYDHGQLFVGRVPFHDISPYLAAFHISEGKRPLRPDGDENVVILPNDEEWNLIDLCWRQNPTERPTMGCAAAQLHLIAGSRNSLIPIPPDTNSLLFQCAARGWREDTRALLEEGADVSFLVHCSTWKQVPLEASLSDGNKSQWSLPIIKAISSVDDKPSTNNDNFVSVSSLHAAVDNGDMDITEILLSHGADANVKDSRRLTPLYWAVSHGHQKLVQLLLKHHALPSAADKHGNTPLHIAARASETTIMHFLIGAQSSLVHTSNAAGETALHWACESGAYNAAAALLEWGASTTAKTKQGRTPLQCAFACRPSTNSSASNDVVSLSSLHAAVDSGDIYIAELLLSHGADANVKDSRVWTPLHWAASHGYKELVQLLLKHHALPNAVDGDGNTALHIAARASETSIIHLLVGAEFSLVHTANTAGETALHWACECGAYDAAIALLQRGASPTAATTQGRTPLHCAFAFRSSTSQLESHRTQTQLIMKLLGIDGVDGALLQMSVPLADPDRNGMTPFHLACLHGHVEFLQILIRHSLSLEEHAFVLAHALQSPRGIFERSDHYGWTGLHWAAYCGMARIVRTLLREQVRADQTDIGGWTPLHCVAAGSRTRIDIDAPNTHEGVCLGWQSRMHRVAMSEESHIEIARLLLRAPVSGDLRNSKDSQGRRPLDVLREFRNWQSIDYPEVAATHDSESLTGVLTPPREDASATTTVASPPSKERRKSNPMEAFRRMSSGLRILHGRTPSTSLLPPSPKSSLHST